MMKPELIVRHESRRNELERPSLSALQENKVPSRHPKRLADFFRKGGSPLLVEGQESRCGSHRGRVPLSLQLRKTPLRAQTKDAHRSGFVRELKERRRVVGIVAAVFLAGGGEARKARAASE